MQDLIKRIEAAVGPSRELDAEIWEYLGLAPEYDNSKNNYGCWNYRGEGRYHFADDSSWGKNQHAPLYTSSIDAAMTLAEKHHGDIIHEALSRLSSKFNLHICFWPDSENYSEWLARFVCAAALRARQ